MRNMMILAAVFCLLTFNSFPSYAVQDIVQKRHKILQTYANASIITGDFKKLSSKLNDVVKQYNGTITNFNVNRNEDTGSATIQIPTDNAASFMGEISQFGVIENQNLSTSDYTRSYEENYRKMRVYEMLGQADLNKLFAGMDLSKDEYLIMKAEFESMITNQVRNCKITMDGYENYGKYAQVYLSFRKGENQGQQTSNQLQGFGEKSTYGTKSPENISVIIPLYIAVMINFFFLYFIYKQIKKSPIGS